nr:hypothetical protein [Gammaproteobacteria bacterium]
KLTHYVDLYRPFDDYRDIVYSRADDIRMRLQIYPSLGEELQALFKKHGGSLDDYIFFPVEGRQSLGLIMLREKTGEVVDAMVGSLG